MATNSVKGGTFGREKKATCPSSPSKKPNKPSPSTTLAASSSPSSPTTGKPVPNYLKPTMSSSLDFSRLPKKSTPEPSGQKPVLIRRRSLDRPPLAPSQGAGGREVKHVRSTSFSHNKPRSSGASFTRPVIDRVVYGRSSLSLKEAKVDEMLLSKSRTLKKSSLSSSSPKKGTKTVSKGAQLETRFDGDHSSSAQLGIDNDFVGIDDDVQSLSGISEMPDCSQELGDPSILDVVPVKLNDEFHDDNKGKSNETDEIIFVKKLEPATVADHLRLEMAGYAKDATKVDQTDIQTEKNNSRGETKDDGNTSVSSTSASAGVSPAQAQKGDAGKKKKQEYNDVIEETATKLMGGNKNKVLALAGAFDTVISLQDTSTNQ